MYNESIQHGIPFSLLHGIVLESAIKSPHSSFYEANEYYALTLTFPDTAYVEEIERIFAENGSHDIPSEPLWKIDKYTVRATSLIMPRRNTAAKGELDNAGLLDVRVKTSLNVGEYVVQEQLLLVMISDIQEIDFDSLPDLGYNF
jgi:hypothetical protein